MDLYVLTENGHVLGVGTDRSVCEDIADRRGDRWGEWIAEAEGGAVRYAAVTPGGVLRDVQKIVRVPLAGSLFPAATDPLAGLKPIKPIDDRWGGSGAGAIYRTREMVKAMDELNLAFNRTVLSTYVGYMKEIAEIGRSFGAP